MAWFGAAAATVLILVIFIDTFEMLILPRRVKHSFRLGRQFYRSTWFLWRTVARIAPPGPRRNTFLSIFGPLSLFGLMFVWATGLIVGFALLHWAIGTSLTVNQRPDETFVTYVYFSGTTFFTLGYGDVITSDTFGRALSVAEAGIGFGFLAIVISYLPVLYQAFSRREITISLLDARAGSPPTAGELLRRLAEARAVSGVQPMLAEWERWSAELLETHLSYPVLSYYRSQHDNQSWVAALTAILDTSALLIAGVGGTHGHPARLTFAMARHAAVDLSLVYQRPPLPPEPDRLPTADLCRLLALLRSAGMEVHEQQAVAAALAELRALYEPFVNALAAHFLFELPGFSPRKPPVDNWQTTPWTPRSPGLGGLPAAAPDHDRVH